MLAGALHYRGYLRGLQGRYAEGLEDLRQSQRLYEKLGMAMQAMTTVSGIATTYMRMGDLTQALAIYREALQQQRAAGMRREQLVTEHNIGRVLEKQGDWTEAARAFESSLQLSRDLQYPRGEAFALRGLAAAAQGRGDAQHSLQLLDSASALQKQVADARLGASIASAPRHITACAQQAARGPRRTDVRAGNPARRRRVRRAGWRIRAARQCRLGPGRLAARVPVAGGGQGHQRAAAA